MPVDAGLACRIPLKYMQSVLNVMGMLQSKPVATPFMTCRPEDKVTPATLQQAELIRSVVGKVLWIIPERPDLSFAVKELAKQVANPTLCTWEAAKRLLRYMAGTMRGGMVYRIDTALEPLQVIAMADANWASSDDAKSTSGATIWVQGFVVQHFSRTQSTIALSSCDAELLALNTIAAEAKMVQSILMEMTGKEVGLTLRTDSTSATAALDRLGFGKRLRHLRVRQLWLQEEIRSKRMLIDRVSSFDNTADVLTKQNDRKTFERHLQSIGMQFFWQGDDD
jgi:hypothetical protein